MVPLDCQQGLAISLGLGPAPPVGAAGATAHGRRNSETQVERKVRVRHSFPK